MLSFKPSSFWNFEQYLLYIILEMASKERRGRWKKTQKELFLKGLNKYGKNWVQIQKIIKTRSVAQIRSHAQKIFLSMTKYEQRALEAELNGRFQDFCHPEATKKIKKERKKSISSTGDSQKGLDQFEKNSLRSEMIDEEKEVKEVKIEAPEPQQVESTISSQRVPSAPHPSITMPSINPSPPLIGLLTEYFQRANAGLMQELIRTNMKLYHS